MTMPADKMTDAEIVRKCAEKMGMPITYEGAQFVIGDTNEAYNPLHDDAQAMALVKKFKLSVGFSDGWGCRKDDEKGLKSGAFHYSDLNRAICECVAKL